VGSGKDAVVEALTTLADAAYAHLREISDTKYGPVATSAKELKALAEDGEYEDVLAGNLPRGQYADIGTLDDNDVLVVDTDNVPITEIIVTKGDRPSEYSDLVDAFTQLHKAANGFPIRNRRGVAKVMKSEAEAIDEVIDRFRDRVPRQLLPVLEEALVLREMDRVQGLDQDEIRDLRYEIGDQYSSRGHDPQEAQHLVSLCAMGYFDADGVFDRMYDDLVTNGQKTQAEFQDVFKQYVNKNPFAVFARPRDKDVDRIVDEATTKASRILQWPGSPEFVDICGKGRAQGLVRDAHSELEGEFDGEIEPSPSQDPEQYVLRLFPAVSIE